MNHLETKIIKLSEFGSHLWDDAEPSGDVYRAGLVAYYRDLYPWVPIDLYAHDGRRLGTWPPDEEETP